MSGRIVSDDGHLCGGMPSAVGAYAVWECDCGQQWVYEPAHEGYISWSGCWIPGRGVRWERRKRGSAQPRRRWWQLRRQGAT